MACPRNLGRPRPSRVRRVSLFGEFRGPSVGDPDLEGTQSLITRSNSAFGDALPHVPRRPGRHLHYRSLSIKVFVVELRDGVHRQSDLAAATRPLQCGSTSINRLATHAYLAAEASGPNPSYRLGCPREPIPSLDATDQLIRRVQDRLR